MKSVAPSIVIILLASSAVLRALVARFLARKLFGSTKRFVGALAIELITLLAMSPILYPRLINYSSANGASVGLLPFLVFLVVYSYAYRDAQAKPLGFLRGGALAALTHITFLVLIVGLAMLAFAVALFSGNVSH
jgi:hypothetical protein